MGKVAELLQRGQGVQVRVAGDPTQARAILQTVDWISGVTQQGDILHVDAPSSRAPEINALLAHHAVLIAEIRAREASLEDFFLEITQAGKGEETR